MLKLKTVTWNVVGIVLASMLAVSFPANADEKTDALTAFKLAYQSSMIHTLRGLKKGAPVTVQLWDGKKVSGTFKRYQAYDDSVWIVPDGRWFADAYSVQSVQDIRLVLRRPV